MATTKQSPRRVTYFNPAIPLCGVMNGTESWDEWEGETMFIPDAEHGPSLAAYGYEPEGALYLEGATITPL